MPGDPKIRVFIALKTPPSWDDHLGRLQQHLAARLHGTGQYRWVKPEQLHLTLRFLGSITLDDLAQVTAVLQSIVARFKPFTLSSASLGCFPRPSSPKVLWAGIQESEPLSRLHHEIQEATASIGHPPETRPFHPHLTLARIKDFHRNESPRLTSELQAVQNLPPWPVNELILLESLLSPHGATYHPRATYPFPS